MVLLVYASVVSVLESLGLGPPPPHLHGEEIFEFVSDNLVTAIPVILLVKHLNTANREIFTGVLIVQFVRVFQVCKIKWHEIGLEI